MRSSNPFSANRVMTVITVVYAMFLSSWRHSCTLRTEAEPRSHMHSLSLPPGHRGPGPDLRFQYSDDGMNQQPYAPFFGLILPSVVESGQPADAHKPSRA